MLIPRGSGDPSGTSGAAAGGAFQCHPEAMERQEPQAALPGQWQVHNLRAPTPAAATLRSGRQHTPARLLSPLSLGCRPSIAGFCPGQRVPPSWWPPHNFLLQPACAFQMKKLGEGGLVTHADLTSDKDLWPFWSLAFNLLGHKSGSSTNRYAGAKG